MAVGVQMSFGNIFQLLGTLSPLILSAFLIISSISNQDMKWIMFLAGLIITTVVFTVITFAGDMKFEDISNPASAYHKGICNFIQLPFGLSEYTAPNFNSTILAFIFFYLYMPMVQNNSYNTVLLSIILVLFVIDGYTKYANGCTPIIGIVLGLFFGFLMGYLWYFILVKSNNEALVYFNTPNGDPICNRPSKQQFKCAVYKNGEIIKNL